MKKILIVVAVEKELQYFLTQSGVTKKSQNSWYKKSGTTELTFLVTGAGIFQTVFYLSNFLVSYTPDIVINAGIAGSFERGISIGSLVEVIKDHFADFGSQDNCEFIPGHLINLSPTNDTVFSNGWIETISKTKLPAVIGATVNTCHGNTECIHDFLKRYEHEKPQIETMEGAAAMYVSKSKNIDFLQIRAISNYVAKRDLTTWRIDDAVLNLNKYLQNLISTFSFKE